MTEYSKLALENPDEETITICLECDSQEGIRRIGEDYLNYCPCCRSIEGRTKEVLISELE